MASRNGSGQLWSIDENTTVGDAILTMSQHGIDQAPVTKGDELVGSLSDTRLLKHLIEDPSVKNKPVREIMDASFQFVGLDNTLDVLSSLINKDTKALLVRDEHNRAHIITQSDLLVAMSS